MHRVHRLRSSADFSQTMRDGRRTTAPGLVLYHVERSTSSTPRVGFAVGRALGSAVVRNRIRRRLREAVRLLLSQMQPCDVVVVARPEVTGRSVQELARSIGRALSEAGVIPSRPAGALDGTMRGQNPSPDATEGTSS